MEHIEISSPLLGLSATFCTRVHKVPEVIKKLSSQSFNSTKFCTTFKLVSHFKFLKYTLSTAILQFPMSSTSNGCHIDSNDPHQPCFRVSSRIFPSASITTLCQESSAEHLHGGTHRSSEILARFSSGSSCASDLFFKTTFSIAMAARPRSARFCSWRFISAASPSAFEFSSISRCWTSALSHFNYSSSRRGTSCARACQAAPTEPRGRIPFDKAFRSACFATIVSAVFKVAFLTATLSITDLTVAILCDLYGRHFLGRGTHLIVPWACAYISRSKTTRSIS